MAEPVVRKVLNMPPDLWDRIADYRFNKRFHTEGETFRDLLEKGLAVTDAEKNNGAVRPEA